MCILTCVQLSFLCSLHWRPLLSGSSSFLNYDYANDDVDTDFGEDDRGLDGFLFIPAKVVPHVIE